MNANQLKAIIAILGGWASLFVTARMGGALWEMLLSFVAPGVMLYALDWALDRIWPWQRDDQGKDGPTT